MPDFSANLSLLFSEFPLPERFRHAADAGFDTIEIQFPYEMSIGAIERQLNKHQLQLNLINFPAGDWAAGERGIACHPDRRQEFCRGVDLAIEYATALGCPQINCLAGIPPAGVSETEAMNQLSENLVYAAEKLTDVGLLLNIEPINTVDIPGFLLSRSTQAAELIRALGLTNLRLQYDVYHMQIMGDDLAVTLRRLQPIIGHIQIADWPGRHEPGSGKINFSAVFRQLELMGYTGRVALEYNPLGSTESGLGWMKACR